MAPDVDFAANGLDDYTEYSEIPKLTLSGSSYEIGIGHGTQLRRQIISQLYLYREMFQLNCKMPWPQVLRTASEYETTIQRLAPDLAAEMKGIAEGVNGGKVADERGELDENERWKDSVVTYLDIVALNSRSEIAFGQWNDGCTSLSWHSSATPLSPQRQLLAQNWDWKRIAIPNLALLHILQTGKSALWMVAEAGIVGKIGFNESSVGVCLNAIRAKPVKTTLLPVHVLLRVILQCTSLAEARARVDTLGGCGSSQHILAVDATGAVGMEVTPLGTVYIPPSDAGTLVHTNHLLGSHKVESGDWLKSSPLRLERAKQLCADIQKELRTEGKASFPDPSTLRSRVFSDTLNSPLSVCAAESVEDNNPGTLFNIVMELGLDLPPRAEVQFGMPGLENKSPIYSLPW